MKRNTNISKIKKELSEILKKSFSDNSISKINKMLESLVSFHHQFYDLDEKILIKNGYTPSYLSEIKPKINSAIFALQEQKSEKLIEEQLPGQMRFAGFGRVFDENRKKGFFDKDGITYYRQPLLSDSKIIKGKKCEISFALNETVKGYYAIIDIGILQPSHIGSVQNPLHFIPEAQPRNRATSQSGSTTPKLIAEHLRPAEIVEGSTGYTGAPVVNKRGEVIQGNGRAYTLRHYFNNFQGDPAGYEKYLEENKSCLGFKYSKLLIQQPIIVRMVEVSDEEAIRLGQYTAKDLEAVANETTQIKSKVGLITDEVLDTLLDDLLASDTADKTLSELIRESQIFKLLIKNDIIRKDDLEVYTRNGSINETGINFIIKFLLNLIFKDADVNTPDIFLQLPVPLQKAIEKSALYILKCRDEKSISAEVSKAIVGLRDYLIFKPNGSIKDWTVQKDIFHNSNKERYSPLELSIIEIFSENTTQKKIIDYFKKYAQLVNDQPGDMFSTGTKAISKTAAVLKVFGVKYIPSEKKQKKEPKVSSGKEKLVLPTDSNINHNKKRNGIEVKFETKPDPEYISVLKELGFKWSPDNKLWYSSYSGDKMEEVKTAFSETFAGLSGLKNKKSDMKKGSACNCFLGLEILSADEEKNIGSQMDGLSGDHKNPYDIIREKIIAAIDKEGLKWVKSWAVAKMIKPMNFKTKSQYSGLNLLFLGILLGEYNTNNPYFLSYKQALDLGGQVKEGSKGIPIFYWSTEGKSKQTRKVKINTKTGKPVKDSDPVDDSNTVEVEEKLKFSFLKYYTVFHASDIEGIDWKDISNVTSTEAEKIDSAEAIIAGMPNPPEMIHQLSDRAFYSPGKDSVTMPKIEQFRTEQEYYGTFFHELIHSTGHPSRLKREFGGRFGDKKYAFEELIAEIGGSFLCGEAGILNFTFQNTAAYIQGWHRSLKKNLTDDKNFIIKAARRAEEAADYMLDKKKEVKKTEPKKTTERAMMINMEIGRNKVKNGIEVKFDAKPDPEYIKVLKELGFKWSQANQVWYAPFSEEKLKEVKEVFPETVSGLSGNDKNPDEFKECIEQFVQMHDKEIKIKEILLLIKKIQRNIYRSKEDKNSEIGICVMSMQKKLAKAYNFAIDTDIRIIKIKINNEDLTRYKKIISSGLGNIQRGFPSTATSQKMGFWNTTPIIEPTIDSKNTPEKTLGKTPKAPSCLNERSTLTRLSSLSGVEADEFGFIRADKAAKTDKSKLMVLPGEIGKLIQHINRHRYAITLKGPKGGGKTQVIMQLADAFAEAGEEVAIFMLEQGGLESSDTTEARDRNIKQKNFPKIAITGQANDGIDTIKKLAATGKFGVVIIDSWQKLKIVSTRFDELRQEFPNIIWIVVFQENAEGGTRGGSASEFDANVVLVIHKVDKSFMNNWVELDKNRGNSLDKHYIISEKKTYDGFAPQEKEEVTKEEEK